MNTIVKTLFKSALAGIVALSFISCGNKTEDPALTAIKERIAAAVGEDAHIQINSFAKIDSVTYGQELEYRKNLFDKKLRKTEEFYEKYMREHKPNNAKKKLDEFKKTKEIIAGLAKLEEQLKDSLDIIAYYDYRISGKASNKTTEVNFPEYYASVSKDNEVLYLQASRKGLHRTNGRVIPGYTAILKGETEEDSAE